MNPTIEDLQQHVANIDAMLGALSPMLAKCSPTGETAKAFGLLARTCGELSEARSGLVAAYACFGVRPT